MMSIKIKTISMVRIPPPKCRKYLFHVALTNKNQTNGSVRLVFVCIYFFYSAKNPALNSGVFTQFFEQFFEPFTVRRQENPACALSADDRKSATGNPLPQSRRRQSKSPGPLHRGQNPFHGLPRPWSCALWQDLA